MKRFLISTILTMSIIYILYNSTTTLHYSTSKQSLQQNIAKKIIRFHVIGNSDSTYDQTIKLQIKSAIVEMLNPLLADSTNIKTARSIIAENLDKINLTATKILKKNKLPYHSSTILTTHNFPIKQYGDMTLPAGDYEAVCVRLGQAKGKNWWCVLYPSLCFVDSTHAILPKSSKDKLRHTLTSTEYNYIIKNPDTTITYTTFFSKLFNLNNNSN